PNLAVVVFPRDAERDDPVGLRYPAQDLVGVVGFLVLDATEDVLGHGLHCLDELGLVRSAPFDAFHECRKIDVVGNCHSSLPFAAALRTTPAAYGPGGRDYTMPRLAGLATRAAMAHFRPSLEVAFRER